MRIFLSTLALLAVTACSVDPQLPKSTVEPEKVILSEKSDGVYKLDPSHANVVFLINHLGFSNYIGRFDKIDGTLNLDATNVENSKISMVVKAASINTNHDVLEGKLRGPAWFNAAKYPDIRFESTRIVRTGDNTAIVHGNMTLLGVTKPTQFDVAFNKAGENPMSKTPMLGFSARGNILRSQFGLKEGIPFVGDEVTLMIETEFEKK